VRVKTWKILDRGNIPHNARTVEFTCMTCGRDAHLPVVGLAIAQVDEALIFDHPGHAIPPLIQCRKCGHVYEQEPAHVR
jgi:DNA-directed RNA polymerase subunit RPC12/RpoP